MMGNDDNPNTGELFAPTGSMPTQGAHLAWAAAYVEPVHPQQVEPEPVEPEPVESEPAETEAVGKPRRPDWAVWVGLVLLVAGAGIALALSLVTLSKRLEPHVVVRMPVTHQTPEWREPPWASVFPSAPSPRPPSLLPLPSAASPGPVPGGS